MRKRWMVRVAALVAAGFLFSGTGAAYYYFTYFNSSAPPYTPIPARYDLTTLNNNTVPFFISGAGPSSMYPGDTFKAIISQISAAAGIWNGVSTSSIQLAFKGLYSAGTTESAPGIQIEFSNDVPPGLLAFTTLESFGNLTQGPNGAFIPLYLSVMTLPSDLGSSAYFNGPSYSEQFFVTLVHEFGHTVGLQHTLASSVMATYNTTASTKASPLGADDIAGISLLYPAGNYLSTVGSISGKVTLNGNGVNLASVVAIAANSQAIATLTNPDGTYQLNGIPTGPSGFSIEYYVYVHPLPAPLQGEGSPDNIFYPHNSNGVFLAPDTGFVTQFYPNPRDPSQPQTFTVKAGSVTDGVNFSVATASSPAISSVRTYGYICDKLAPSGTSCVKNTYVVGAPLMVSETTTIAAAGTGLLQPYTASQSSYSLTPGLSVSMIGSAAQISNLRPYTPPNPFVAVNVSVSSLAGSGPKHLLFSTPGNLYVLPSGFTVVQASPPTISALGPAVDGNGNPAVAIAGQEFTPTTQVLFDGLPAVIQSQASDLLIVTPPPAPAGYVAAVAVFNPDGQSSLFLAPSAPTYTYPSGVSFALAANPSLVVSPSMIPAGGSVTLEVRGINTNFTAGVTTVGFGTSDVQVNQVNILTPTRLTAVLSSAVAVPSSVITVTTGLEVVSQALGSEIAAIDQP